MPCNDANISHRVWIAQRRIGVGRDIPERVAPGSVRDCGALVARIREFVQFFALKQSHAGFFNTSKEGYAPIASTTRPLTFPALRRWKTSLIESRGCVSMIALTLPSAAKLKASSRSSRVPTIEPRMV